MSASSPSVEGAIRHPLLAIGGVGGSGTRVVADVAIALGIHMGGDLNGPLDNLAFTLLFKEIGAPALGPDLFRVRADVFSKAMCGKGPLDADEIRIVQALVDAGDRPAHSVVQHGRDWLQERAENLKAAAAGPPLDEAVPWGWKEPNTHVVLPQLLTTFPRLRYVHVVRNGLDMALSQNLNQLDFWGHWWLGRAVSRTPRDALSYWCSVQRRAQCLQSQMEERFLWLDYDDLCEDPLPHLRRLVRFLGCPADLAGGLLGRVAPQESSGRRRLADLSEFAPSDLAYLRSLGHLH